MNDLTLTLALLMLALFLIYAFLKLARNPVPSATPTTFRVRYSSPCPHCHQAVGTEQAKWLHRELGLWRAGRFRRPCVKCGQPVWIIVEEEG